MERELDVREQFLLYLMDIVKDSKEVTKEIDEGCIEIMDRYYFSTVAYQSANGFGYENAKQIVGMLDLRKPDIAFHIDMPVELSMSRKDTQRVNDENSKSDRHEADASLQERTRSYYRRMVEEVFGSKRWVTVDGSKTPEAISSQISKVVDSELDKTKAKLA
jgi:dTMP kinase